MPASVVCARCGTVLARHTALSLYSFLYRFVDSSTSLGLLLLAWCSRVGWPVYDALAANPVKGGTRADTPHWHPPLRLPWGMPGPAHVLMVECVCKIRIFLRHCAMQAATMPFQFLRSMLCSTAGSSVMHALYVIHISEVVFLNRPQPACSSGRVIFFPYVSSRTRCGRETNQTSRLG